MTCLCKTDNLCCQHELIQSLIVLPQQTGVHFQISLWDHFLCHILRVLSERKVVWRPGIQCTTRVSSSGEKVMQCVTACRQSVMWFEFEMATRLPVTKHPVMYWDLHSDSTTQTTTTTTITKHSLKNSAEAQLDWSWKKSKSKSWSVVNFQIFWRQDNEG